MKKIVVLVSTLFTLIIILCSIGILYTAEKWVSGECTLPASTAGIEVYVKYQGETVGDDETDSAGKYYIDASTFVTDRNYNFYATDGLGEHFWNFTYNGGLINHDFALAVY